MNKIFIQFYTTHSNHPILSFYDKIEKKLANYEDSPKKEKIKSIIYQEGIELILIASKEIIGWINVNVLKNYRGNCCYSAILNNLNLNTFYAINECTSKILRILQEN